MNIKNKLFAFSLIGLLAINCFSQTKSADIKPVQAKSAVDFLNSIGVNSAISKRAETLAKTTEAINYTGIRWIRTGYEGDIPVQDLITLHKRTGVKFSYGLLSGGTDIPRLLAGGKQLSAAGCLLAFEGSNEPNNWGFTYNGEKGGKTLTWLPIAKLQRDLYAAIKSDDAVKDYPVWALTETGAETDNVGLQYITIPTGAGTLMPDGTKYADYATCHNYISHPSWPGLHDNQAWIAASPSADSKVDGLYGNYGKTWYKKFTGYSEDQLQMLPRVTTETGLTIGDGVTEEEHALLLTDMYLAQFKRGWSYTAVYLLRDRSDEEGNQQFGFYKTDYTPRKAAVYLHNLTTILTDKKPTENAAALQYAIPNQPPTVHDLLLQKSNGNFYLVVWGEKLTGTDDIEIDFGKTQSKVIVYNPTKDTNPIETLKNTNSIQLTMANYPYIIEVGKQ